MSPEPQHEAPEPEKPSEPDKRSLGASIQNVSERAVRLVQDEIELAKAELSEKFGKLLKGAGITAVIAVFMFWMIAITLIGLALLANWGFGWDDGQQFWGFFLVAGVLVLLSAIGGLIAFRLFRAGSPPIPSQAIEEAQKFKDSFGAESELPYDPPTYKHAGGDN
ncbi:MAG TPA: phage holin family protein [Baekduia sp.]|nr:phage holin family protein [Baekduia sp.]